MLQCDLRLPLRAVEAIGDDDVTDYSAAAVYNHAREISSVCIRSRARVCVTSTADFRLMTLTTHQRVASTTLNAAAAAASQQQPHYEKFN